MSVLGFEFDSLSFLGVSYRKLHQNRRLESDLQLKHSIPHATIHVATHVWWVLFIGDDILKVKCNAIVCCCYTNLSTPRESPTVDFRGGFLLSDRTYNHKKFQYTKRREVWGCSILLTDFLQIWQKPLDNRQVKFVTRRGSKII